MVVFAWIGQILLFFILWKVFHWLTTGAKSAMGGTSLVKELVINVALAIILLIVLTNIHTAWWTMPIVGAVVGVVTGGFAAKSST